MRLETAFRLSVYLTLALATLCLGFAEEVFLPGVVWFVLLVEAVIAVGFVLEGRWALSLSASNVLGSVLAAAAVAWLAWCVLVPSHTILSLVPMPAALLPEAGPVLMVLILGKLFRPKQASDHWTLYGMGLLEVTLACVLVGAAAFALLLLAYVATATWSLMVFHLWREYRAQEGAAGQAPAASPWRWLGVPRAAGRALAVVALGLVLFLVSPHRGTSQWDAAVLQQSDRQTGFAEVMDLNTAGRVALSNRVAFRVYATDAAGNPLPAMSSEQRWRGVTFANYDSSGRWTPDPTPVPGRATNARALPTAVDTFDRPELGPERRHLTFEVDVQEQEGLFLADPVRVGADDVLPVAAVAGQQSWTPVFDLQDQTLRPRRGRPRTFNYHQVAVPPEGVDAVPADHLGTGYKPRLAIPPSGRIRTWTADLCRRLAAQGVLEPADLRPGGGRGGDREPVLVPASRRERVARALARHLAGSGEFTYTLRQRRTDTRLEPTEDFLFNTKEGHCEHYAAALGLMLRALGIPARVVHGFRGVDPGDDGPGWFVVRERHAHSWVEALVERPGSAEVWLTLDPTPSDVAQEAGRSWWSTVWGRVQNAGQNWWWNWVIDYGGPGASSAAGGAAATEAAGGDSVSVTGAVGALGESPWFWLAAVPVVLLVGLAVWQAAGRRRRGAALRLPVTGVAFYNRLVALVYRRWRLHPQDGQTPLEFAGEAGAVLGRETATAGAAGIPAEIVQSFYEVRYGGRALPPHRLAEVEQGLVELEAAGTRRR